MSEDRRRYAYFGRVGDTYYPVIDGATGEPSDRDPTLPLRGWRDHFDSPYLCPSGNHLAYPVLKGDSAFMVIDGKKDGPFTWMWPPVWSDDESHCGYIAGIKGKLRVVVDHAVDVRFQALGGAPVFSKDGRRVAFVALDDRDKQFVVIDGTPSDTYGDVDQLTFSPGGQHVAYVAWTVAKTEQRNGKPGHCFVVLDGRRQETYDKIGNLTFSGDGRHLAFSARLGDRHLVVWDGKELEDPNPNQEGYRASAFDLTFSPDNSHICWGTCTDEKAVVVLLDGKVVDRSSYVCEAPRFSRDSSHVAFGAINGREIWWRVVKIAPQ
jgi:hypothetical protein